MRRFYNIFNNICESKYCYIVFLLLSIAFVSFYSYSTSPLYVFEGMDSYIFKLLGLGILNGKVPYVDLFDHKGPVLYFINALGQWIVPGRIGLFYLQIIGETIVFIFLFKIARLFVDGIKALISVLFTIFLFGGIYQEGNQCEEWILICTIPSLYYALKCFLYDTSLLEKYISSLCLGISFGLSFFIRPTDGIALCCGAIFGMTWYYILNKNIRFAFFNFVNFTLGFLIVCLPIVLYFVYHEAIVDLFYGLIGFNSKYSGGIVGMITSCIGHHRLPIMILWMTIAILIYNSDARKSLYIIFPMIVFSSLLIGHKSFPHYLISFLMFFLLWSVFVLRQKSYTLIILSCFIFYCSSYAYSCNFLKSAIITVNNYITNIKTCNHDDVVFYKECDKIFSNIPNCERDSIWNYNLMWLSKPYSSILIRNSVIQCNVVPLYDLYILDVKLKEKDNICVKRPLYVLLTHDYDDFYNGAADNRLRFDTDYKFVEDKYDLVYKTDSTICNIELYKRR